MIWHSQDINSVLRELNTDPNSGLTSEEAERRLREHGTNEVAKAQNKAVAEYLPHFFSKSSIILLVLALIWTIAAIIWKASILEPIFLLLFVILKGMVFGGFTYFGRKGILSLCNGQKPTATVVRDGETKEILCSQLVPGDIIQLKKGDLIPADCRLISSLALHCDEESLNCEHGQIEKTADIAGIPDIAPISQRQNMLYMGCAILDGVATAVVTDTGISTELGKKQQGANTADIASLSVCESLLNSRRLTVLAELALCILILLVGIIRGLIVDAPFWSNLLYWITAAACGISAFLPGKDNPVGYILCYLKLRQMHKNKIFVNRLDTLDKLHKTSVICCDKTGSITKSGHMELMQIYDGKSIFDIHELSESAARVLHLAALCCDGQIEYEGGQEKRSGDSTQTAIISAALRQLNLTGEDLKVTYPRMASIPFDRERKTMCSVNMIGGNNLCIVRGAPDNILPMCTRVDADSVNAVATAMASRALRVIAVAVKPLQNIPANLTNADMECDLQFIGLLGLYNPPRKDALAAVEDCRKNGIKTVMLTGDDPQNAAAYAKSLGILTNDAELLDKSALLEMTDAELYENINRYTVFAGATGDSKTRIVKALQAAGHTVLMTGDSIEDIPALRAADIGYTPAKLGTDIAKHASDLVASGGLAAIAASIFHVRHLYHSIRSVFTLLCGFGISVFLFTLLSAFTGNSLSFAQLLLCGLLSQLCLPLYFGFTKTAKVKNSKGKYRKLALYISMIVAPVAALIADLLTPGASVTTQLFTLLIGYALLAHHISLGSKFLKNIKYAAIHLLPVLSLIILLVLLSCFAPGLGFVPIEFLPWVLILLLSCGASAAYRS